MNLIDMEYTRVFIEFVLAPIHPPKSDNLCVWVVVVACGCVCVCGGDNTIMWFYQNY